MMEVRRLRQARGWNQTELAYHSGLAPSVISQIENGKRDPSAGTLRKLAKALEVGVPDLFPKAQPSLPFETHDKVFKAWAAAAATEDLLRERERLSERVDGLAKDAARSPEERKARRPLTAEQQYALHHLAPTADELHTVIGELAGRLAQEAAETA